MSDEFHRLWAQQEALRRMMDPLVDLRPYIDPPVDVYKQLGIGSETMDFLRKEEERRRIWPDITDVGSLTKISMDYERQRNLIEGPIEEARRAGLFDPLSHSYKSVSAALEARQACESLFRLPQISELGWIAHDAMERSELARAMLENEDRLQAAMHSMQSPWLQLNDGNASAKAFSEIIAMGRGIDIHFPFDHDFSIALRSSLGDWRDTLMPTQESLLEPALRSGFYLEQGFDSTLADFPPMAFDDSVRIARLRHSAPVESQISEEDGFARANDAFDQLFRFEVAIRRFIERVMRKAYGENWMKSQLPANMLESWVEKRDKAVNAGCAAQPLIDYADFTDYRAIIERRDNWNTVFKHIFGRPEDIRESFQRLYPVRIATMHARLINQDDQLLLLVETKRVLKTIGGR